MPIKELREYIKTPVLKRLFRKRIKNEAQTKIVEPATNCGIYF